MKSAAQKVQAIIAAAAPNLAGKSDFYDVAPQIAREQRFYVILIQVNQLDLFRN